MSWDDTEDWASLLGVPTPRVMYRGPWSEDRLQALEIDTDTCEGYVVRTVEGFSFDQFTQHLAKWVRPHHVQTDQHWMHSAIEVNQLGEIK